MAELEVRALTVCYRSRRDETVALRGVSAAFPEGINVIVGESGCGKTTLLRAILGLVEYDGEILFEGSNIDDVPTKDRGFSFVPQDYALYPQYTVFENIAFPLKQMGAGRDEILLRVRRMAERTGLTPCLTRKPRHISGGQQQRVALARALVREPSVCLLDEPLSNIDEPTRAFQRQWLKQFLHASNCLTLYVTHDFRSAMALADHIFVMEAGNILLYGTPEDVYHSENEAVRYLKEASHLT